MKRMSWLGVLSVALMAAGCSSSYYDREPGSYRVNDRSDFNGSWQLVTRRSDTGRDWFEERNLFGTDDWGTTDRTSPTVRYGYRAWFLPDAFRIQGVAGGTMRIEDESGGLIAEIPMDADYRAASSYPDRDTYYERGLRVRWLSDRRFEVRREGRTRRITQTFSLERRGGELVVHTEVVRDEGRRSYSRVYQRV